MEQFKNYYQEGTEKRPIAEDLNFVKEKTLVIESSAWNLNILLILPEKKIAIEYNRPFIGPLDPTEIKNYQEKSIIAILPEILYEIRDSTVEYIYCEGPGLALSLSAVVYLYERITPFCNVISYPVFHGLSHLAEVLFKKVKKRYLFCYFSGGSTQFILKTKEYQVVAETLDITIGNLLDIYTKRILNKKPIEIVTTSQEIYPFLKDTIKYCQRFPRYFNLSGILEIMKSWSYPKLLSFVINLLLKFIIEIKEKNIFFSGGVFNSEGIRQTLNKLCPKDYIFYFEENNSDKAYMHLLNKHLNKIKSSTQVNYNSKLRIVDDYTPMKNNKKFNLPNTLKEFLNYFSLQDNKNKRRLIYYLKNQKEKNKCKYLKVLNYRRHLPLK